MGVVYKAHDTVLDRLVAIKVLASHLTWGQKFVQRFLQEARAAARLKHAHIVTIHDVVELSVTISSRATSWWGRMTTPR